MTLFFRNLAHVPKQLFQDIPYFAVLNFNKSGNTFTSLFTKYKCYCKWPYRSLDLLRYVRFKFINIDVAKGNFQF
jgi:hypothetical protein